MNGRRVVITQISAFMGKDLVELFGAEGAALVADDRDLKVPGAAEALSRFEKHRKVTPMARCCGIVWLDQIL